MLRALRLDVQSLGLDLRVCDDAYGYESYDQVQSVVDHESTSTYFDEDAGVNIATYAGYQWMSYENKESLAKKVEYASAHCIGGETY